jgi:hypothetical protein
LVAGTILATDHRERLENSLALAARMLSLLSEAIDRVNRRTTGCQ